MYLATCTLSLDSKELCETDSKGSCVGMSPRCVVCEYIRQQGVLCVITKCVVSEYDKVCCVGVLSASVTTATDMVQLLRKNQFEFS